MITYRIAGLLCAGSLLASCAGSGAGPLGLGAVIGDRNLASAEPLFSEEEERCLDRADQLLALIYGPAETTDGNAACTRIRRTLRYIVDSGDPPPNATPRYMTPRYTAAQRNEIVDALIASSNRKCTRYVSLLKNADGAMNGTLSVGAIITGGLGSFVGGPAAARALAGTAGILSGSRAALNETYLSNQTIHVLAAAFDKARREQRRAITNRQQCTTEEYTLMRGIEDALAYHNSCSLVAGLAETAKSIERSENPGVDAMRQTFADFANLSRQVSEFDAQGPITPISPAPAPVSLASLQAADVLLSTQIAAVAANEAAEKAAQTALDSAKADLTNGKAKQQDVNNAQQALDTAHADTLRAKTARDEASKARNREVLALVQAVTGPEPAAQTETRICPFSRTS